MGRPRIVGFGPLSLGADPAAGKAIAGRHQIRSAGATAFSSLAARTAKNLVAEIERRRSTYNREAHLECAVPKIAVHYVM